MDERIYREYVAILKEELQPAMGCTEPIAVAYCAALARKALGALPETVEVLASANIIKNVKSVIVPNTNGQRGIAAAAAAGIVADNADAQLQVLASLTPEQVDAVGAYLQQAAFTVRRADKDYVFDIQVRVTAGADSASVEIAGYHTNVIRIEKNGVVQFHKDYQESGSQHATDRSLLTVEQIIAFANEMDIADVQKTLQRQIDYNWAIAEEGLRGDYGANIGRILLQSYGMSIHNRAKAYAAAGSDARMNGCDLPVVINSGSGNQGLTASLPVIVYAKELGVTQQMLYRALVVSNLVTIHLKTGIGSLSAYCGATAAGCGAAAGVTYLYGGQYREIAHTIVNAVAIDSGMICDGAKASCAAKIASAVEAGLLGMQMQMHESQFYGGDGIVVKGVENTIRNIGTLASEGMRETDRTIIRMMSTEIHTAYRLPIGSRFLRPFSRRRRIPIAFCAQCAYNISYFFFCRTAMCKSNLYPRRRAMRLFDILGPVMVGPSSSHTAGAVRIGLTARKLLGDQPVHADISLHGSFALTGHGHGTDCALIAGLLGMQPDDLRIPGSFAIAAEQGLTFAFQNVQLRNAHPNTARLQLTDAKGRTLDIVAESVGGGRIRIRSIDGIETNFSGEHNTLIVHNQDTPGHVAAVTAALMQRHVNIATMQLYRSEQGGYAVMILECDQPIPKDIEQWLSHIEGIQKITIFNQEEPV